MTHTLPQTALAALAAADAELDSLLDYHDADYRPSAASVQSAKQYLREFPCCLDWLQPGFSCAADGGTVIVWGDDEHRNFRMYVPAVPFDTDNWYSAETAGGYVRVIHGRHNPRLALYALAIAVGAVKEEA